MTVVAAISAIVFVAFLGYVVYLVEFTLASRRDPFTDRVSSRAARRARKVTGVYIRGHERGGFDRESGGFEQEPREEAPVVVGWGAPRPA